MLSYMTDPHLGAVRNSHTTTGSRLLLRDRLFDMAMHAVSLKRGPAYCLGDLVDKFANDEETIRRCAQLLQELEAVLGGNHDVRNRADAFGTLQLLAEIFPDKIAVGGTFEEPSYCTDFQRVNGQNVVHFFVPHAITQDNFESLLKQAAADARQCNYDKRILLLHCNYDNPFTEGKDTALNLTRDMAKELLGDTPNIMKKAFDFILLGHEHVPREDFDGRLLILGNTHPLSMGEIEDRFIYHFDGEKFEKEMIWRKSNHYAEIEASRILAADGKINLVEDGIVENYAFIDVIGDLTLEDSPGFAKAMTNFWRSNETLLMCRDNTKRESVALDFEPGKAAANVDIQELVKSTFKGTKFGPLWDKYTTGSAS